jgi:hypothetical protein
MTMQERLRQEERTDRLARVFTLNGQPGEKSFVLVCSDCDHVHIHPRGPLKRKCEACGNKGLVAVAMFLCRICGQLIIESAWSAHKEGDGCCGE